MRKIIVDLPDDLFAHLQALKLYYGYSTRYDVIEKALDELIGKCAGNIVFQYYLSEVRNDLKEVE